VDGDNETRVTRYITYTSWVWIVVPFISAAAAIIAWDLVPATLTVVLMVISVAQAMIAIPAAIWLRRRAAWARIVLLVMGILSISAVYAAFQDHNWVSLVLNIVLFTTYVVLRQPAVKQAFRSV
jgi:hypothetical protein